MPPDNGNPDVLLIFGADISAVERVLNDLRQNLTLTVSTQAAQQEAQRLVDAYGRVVTSLNDVGTAAEQQSNRVRQTWRVVNDDLVGMTTSTWQQIARAQDDAGVSLTRQTAVFENFFRTIRDLGPSTAATMSTELNNIVAAAERAATGTRAQAQEWAQLQVQMQQVARSHQELVAQENAATAAADRLTAAMTQMGQRAAAAIDGTQASLQRQLASIEAFQARLAQLNATPLTTFTGGSTASALNEVNAALEQLNRGIPLTTGQWATLQRAMQDVTLAAQGTARAHAETGAAAEASGRQQVAAATAVLTQLRQLEQQISQVRTAGATAPAALTEGLDRLRGGLALTTTEMANVRLETQRAMQVAEAHTGVLGSFGAALERATRVVVTYGLAFRALNFLLEIPGHLGIIDDQLTRLNVTFERGVDVAARTSMGYDLMKTSMTGLGLTSLVAGESVTLLSKSFQGNQELMSAAIGPVSTLIKLNVDHTDAVRLLAGLYRVYGDSIAGATTPTEKFQAIVDQVVPALARAPGATMAYVSELMRVGTTAGQTGVSLAQTLAILDMLNESMTRAGMGGTELSRILQELTANAPKIAAAFKIPISVDDEIQPLELLTKVLERIRAQGVNSIETWQQLGASFGGGSRGAMKAVIDLANNFEELEAKTTKYQGAAGGAAEVTKVLEGSALNAASAFGNQLLVQFNNFIAAFYDVDPGKQAGFVAWLDDLSTRAQVLGDRLRPLARFFGAISEGTGRALGALSPEQTKRGAGASGTFPAERYGPPAPEPTEADLAAQQAAREAARMLTLNTITNKAELEATAQNKELDFQTRIEAARRLAAQSAADASGARESFRTGNFGDIPGVTGRVDDKAAAQAVQRIEDQARKAGNTQRKLEQELFDFRQKAEDDHNSARQAAEKALYDVQTGFIRDLTERRIAVNDTEFERQMAAIDKEERADEHRINAAVTALAKSDVLGSSFSPEAMKAIEDARTEATRIANEKRAVLFEATLEKQKAVSDKFFRSITDQADRSAGAQQDAILSTAELQLQQMGLSEDEIAKVLNGEISDEENASARKKQIYLEYTTAKRNAEAAATAANLGNIEKDLANLEILRLQAGAVWDGFQIGVDRAGISLRDTTANVERVAADTGNLKIQNENAGAAIGLTGEAALRASSSYTIFAKTYEQLDVDQKKVIDNFTKEHLLHIQLTTTSALRVAGLDRERAAAISASAAEVDAHQRAMDSAIKALDLTANAQQKQAENAIRVQQLVDQNAGRSINFFVDGLQKQAIASGDFYKGLDALSASTYSSIQQSFSGLIFDEFQGKTVSMAATWKTTLTAMEKAVADFLASQALRAILNLAAPFLQGAGSLLNTGVRAIGTAIGFSEGGVAGVDEATPGPLDVIPAFLKAGEVVLNPGQVTFINRLFGAGGVPGGAGPAGLLPGQSVFGVDSLTQAFPGLANFSENFALAGGGVKGIMAGFFGLSPAELAQSGITAGNFGIPAIDIGLPAVSAGGSAGTFGSGGLAANAGSLAGAVTSIIAILLPLIFGKKAQGFSTALQILNPFIQGATNAFFAAAPASASVLGGQGFSLGAGALDTLLPEALLSTTGAFEGATSVLGVGGFSLGGEAATGLGTAGFSLGVEAGVEVGSVAAGEAAAAAAAQAATTAATAAASVLGSATVVLSVAGMVLSWLLNGGDFGSNRVASAAQVSFNVPPLIGLLNSVGTQGDLDLILANYMVNSGATGSPGASFGLRPGGLPGTVAIAGNLGDFSAQEGQINAALAAARARVSPGGILTRIVTSSTSTKDVELSPLFAFVNDLRNFAGPDALSLAMVLSGGGADPINSMIDAYAHANVFQPETVGPYGADMNKARIAYLEGTELGIRGLHDPDVMLRYYNQLKNVQPDWGFGPVAAPPRNPYAAVVRDPTYYVGSAYTGYKEGGPVLGFGVGDSVHAMLEPKEFVVPNPLSQIYADELMHLRNHGRWPGDDDGMQVHVNVNASGPDMTQAFWDKQADMIERSLRRSQRRMRR